MVKAKIVPDSILRKSELASRDGQPRPFIKPFLKRLEKFQRRALMQRRERISHLGHELGMHFEGASSFSAETTLWRLDILPRIISRQEWDHLESGLVQRALAFDALLKDLYSDQQILKDRILPYDLIYDDPAYLLACHGVLPKEQSYLTIGAVDLVRDRSGQWLVTGNHYSTPVGLSYILQNRRMLAQTAPEFFESMPVEPVSGFSSDLIEALSAASPSSHPSIVLLTGGGQEPVTFEESFLARRMGIPIVEPQDLLVRNQRIVMKTLTGLEPIDVIYRRMPSIELDPIAFGSSAQGGIPGLLNCVRQGSVIVANAIGAGVADNRALLPYSDQIIQYYLREIPLLPTVKTYTCRDPDQRLEVEERVDSLLLKPVHREHETGGLYESGNRKSYHRKMKKMLKSHPEWVVAQPYIDASLYPRFIDNKAVNRPAYLRAFTLLGDRPKALPGGLTRQALAEDPGLYVADFAEGTNDTWIPVMQDSPAPQRKKHRNARSVMSFSDFPVSSRVGENLYWMGRHASRAEHIARMVGILLESAWQQIGMRERSNLWPLWQAACQASLTDSALQRKRPPNDISPIARELIVDESNPGSSLNNLRRAHWNAAEIREFITPEVWSCLNQFKNHWDGISHKSRITGTRLQPICKDAVNQFALLNGMINRTMPHDDGWECFRIGMLLERAISTNTVLSIVLPHALRHSDPNSFEDPDLTTLLRMLGSLDAYQREFRSRTYTQMVAQLLWTGDETPNSLAYCVRHIRFSLEAIIGSRGKFSQAPLKRVKALKHEFQSLELASRFPQRNLDAHQVVTVRQRDLDKMAEGVTTLSASFEKSFHDLHIEIEDCFFSHLASSKKPAR